MIPSSGVIDDEEWTAYECWDFSGKSHQITENGDGFIIREIVGLERPRFEIILDPSGKMKQYFRGNEDKIFIVFIHHSKKNTLIKISERIPQIWRGKKVIIDGKEYNTTPVYDLPNHIAIIGKGGELGQEILFV